VINYLSDRIKPWARLHLPPYGDGDWVEWPLGLYVLSSPKRAIDVAGVVSRQVEAYDLAQLFTEDAFEYRYGVYAAETVTEDFEDEEYDSGIAFEVDGSDAEWSRTAAESHGGTYSLVSGSITHDQTSEVWIGVPPGTTSVTFWYKVSSEEGYDYLRIYLGTDEDPVFEASGEVDWTQEELTFTAGQCSNLRVAYEKDESISDGSDCAWVDDLVFTTPEKTYTEVIEELLGDSVQTRIAYSDQVVEDTYEWEPGTTKYTVIGDLLQMVGYDELWFDEDGVAVVEPYVSPSERAPGYVYEDSEGSVLSSVAEQSLDLFKVPNKWVLFTSNPDQSSLVSTYTNTSPASPTSTVNRSRTISKVVQAQSAADQASLDVMTAQVAFDDSQVYEVLEIATGFMPIHSCNDVLDVRFAGLAVRGRYCEMAWEMVLEPGAAMRHTVQRMVSV
jgi:hypothetical protein